MKTFEQKVLVVSSVLLYISSIILLWFDKTFIYRWVTLYLHFFSLMCIFLLWYHYIHVYVVMYIKNLNISSLLPILIILALALSTRFIFLSSYPFVSLGDEVRDGGLQAQQIANGSLLNFFSYGRYEAHGLIIPTITSFFYMLFGPSVLTYRVPAAILSTFDILIAYGMLRIVLRSTAAFLGSLFLISLPLHLFYARTEVVVAFSSFLSSLNLLFTLLYMRRSTFASLITLSALLGFSSQFHTAIRIESLLLLGFIVLHQLFVYIRQSKHVRFFLIAIVLFWFVGFGPRILYTTPQIFFQTNRFPYAKQGALFPYQLQSRSRIPQKYLDTLRVWVDKSTTAWYPDHKPILSPFFFLLFVSGVLHAILYRKPLYLVLLFLLATLSFTNSAMTDMVNGDHRLSPMYPISALFIGLGIHGFLIRIKNNAVRYGLIGIFILLCVRSLLGFFIYQPANTIRTMGDYVGMHAFYFLRGNVRSYATQYQLSKPKLCFYSSPVNIRSWNILHAVEQRQYFLPQYEIELQTKSDAMDYEIFIQKKYDQYAACDYKPTLFSEKLVSCSGNPYMCPKGYTGTISIFYDSLL